MQAETKTMKDEQSAKQSAVDAPQWKLFTEWTEQFSAGEAGEVSVYDGFLAGYDAGVLAERAAQAERLAGLIGGKDEN